MLRGLRVLQCDVRAEIAYGAALGRESRPQLQVLGQRMAVLG